MLVSQEHQLVYIHPAKTGGTSLRAALRERGFVSAIEPDVWHNHEVPAAYDGFTVCGTVRNPFSRYVAWYAHLMGDGGHPERKLRAAEVLDGWGRCDFTTFVRFTIKADRALTPCATMLRRAAIVLRQERLSEEVIRLGLGPLVLGRENAWPHPPWQDCYTRETADLIRQTYAEDFDLYGYSTRIE